MGQPVRDPGGDLGGRFAAGTADRRSFRSARHVARHLLVLRRAGGPFCGWSPRCCSRRRSAARCVTTRFPGLRMLMLATATLLVAQAGVTGKGLAGLALGLAGLLLLYLAGKLDRRSTDRLLPVQLLDLHHPVGAGLLAVFALAVATTGFWAYGPLLLAVMFGVRTVVLGLYPGRRGAGLECCDHGGRRGTALRRPDVDPRRCRAGRRWARRDWPSSCPRARWPASSSACCCRASASACAGRQSSSAPSGSRRARAHAGRGGSRHRAAGRLRGGGRRLRRRRKRSPASPTASRWRRPARRASGSSRRSCRCWRSG